jgi:hypothetical protein
MGTDERQATGRIAGFVAFVDSCCRFNPVKQKETQGTKKGPTTI